MPRWWRPWAPPVQPAKPFTNCSRPASMSSGSASATAVRPTTARALHDATRAGARNRPPHRHPGRPAWPEVARGHVDRSPMPSISVFVNSGLNNPRGLHFGPDRYLYVAEGGIGGTNPACTVVAAVGLYTCGETGGRISRIDSQGHRTTVTDTLPSSQTSMASGSLTSGVADVAFIDGPCTRC